MKNSSKQMIIGKIVFLSLMLIYPLFSQAFAVHAEEEKEDNKVDWACYGVVRVLALDEDTGLMATGSAFGVGREGEPTDTFVTNWHVVTNDQTGEQFDKIWIMLNEGAVQSSFMGHYSINEENMIPCTVIDKYERFPDVAIIKADTIVPERYALALKHTRDSKRGKNIYALGFPGTADNMAEGEYLYASPDQVNVTGGKISKFTKLKSANNSEVIQHTAHMNHGNSGGPLITEDGYVIGINTYVVDTSGTESNYAEYNLSIFIDYAIDLLDKNGISYDMAGDKEAREAASTQDQGESTEEGKKETKKGISIPLPLIGGVVGGVLILFVALVLIIKNKKKKKAMRMQQAEIPADDYRMEDHYGQPEEQNDWMGDYDDGQPTMMALTNLCLVGVSGKYGGKRFNVMSKLRFGRGEDNDFVFDSSIGISRHHCEVYVEQGKLFLRDCGSSNGTFCQGRRLDQYETVRLYHEDTFYLVSDDELFYVDIDSRF